MHRLVPRPRPARSVTPSQPVPRAAATAGGPRPVIPPGGAFEHCRARQGARDLHAARGRSTSRCRRAPEFQDLRKRYRGWVLPVADRRARLVLRLRRPRRLRPRLHGPEAGRQHQRRAGPRAAAVRVDLRRDRRSTSGTPTRSSTRRRPACATTSRETPGDRRSPRPPTPPSAARPSTSRSSPRFVAVTLYLVLKAGKTNKSAADMYTGGAAFSGRQNGVAISGDYLSAASFLGIAGAIALHGLRRLPLQHRLPRRVAHRAAARRRAAAQHRPLHDGRRPVVPHARAAGPHGGRDLDAGRVVLLPAGADGRRRRTRRAAAQHQRPRRAERHHRPRRRPDDRLRAHRRHEGHDLRPDDQGGAAHLGRRAHVVLGAHPLRLQLLRDARRGRRRRRAARARQAVRPEPGHPAGLHLAVAWRSCSAPPACRTS